MAIILTLDQLEAPPTHCIAQILLGKDLPKHGGIWSFKNELKPSDLYCYLYAKFGPPNGIQNILRNDDSDNLIHWDWTLAGEDGLLQIIGLNLRTEFVFVGNWNLPRTFILCLEQIMHSLGNSCLGFPLFVWSLALEGRLLLPLLSSSFARFLFNNVLA